VYSARVSISSGWSRGLVESLRGRPRVFGDVIDEVGSVVFGNEWGVGLEVAPEEFVVYVIVYCEKRLVIVRRHCTTVTNLPKP